MVDSVLRPAVRLSSEHNCLIRPSHSLCAVKMGRNDRVRELKGEREGKRQTRLCFSPHEAFQDDSISNENVNMESSDRGHRSESDR